MPNAPTNIGGKAQIEAAVSSIIAPEPSTAQAFSTISAQERSLQLIIQFKGGAA